MQFAKDSFYAALRERLAELNPERTVVVDGILRPALVVSENEASDVFALDGTFRLTWTDCRSVSGDSGLMKMHCTIEYSTSGVDMTSGDRGRTLSTLDGELLAISQPPRTEKRDFTKIPAASLGTMVFWTDVEFAPPKDEAGRLSRTANTTIYFVREVKR